MFGVASQAAKIAEQVQKEEALRKARQAKRAAKLAAAKRAAEKEASESNDGADRSVLVSDSSVASSENSPTDNQPKNNSVKASIKASFKSAKAKRKAQAALTKSEAAQKAAAKAEMVLQAALDAKAKAEKAAEEARMEAEKALEKQAAAEQSETEKKFEQVRGRRGSLQSVRSNQSASSMSSITIPSDTAEFVEGSENSAGSITLPEVAPAATPKTPPKSPPKIKKDNRTRARSRSRSQSGNEPRSRSLSRTKWAITISRKKIPPSSFSSVAPLAVPLKPAIRSRSSPNLSRNLSVSFNEKADLVVLPWELGDNPSVSAGPPLTVGWDPLKRTNVDLQHWSRESPGKAGKLSQDERMRIVRDSGDYSSKEIQEAIAKAQRCKRWRNTTARQFAEPSGMEALANAVWGNRKGGIAVAAPAPNKPLQQQHYQRSSELEVIDGGFNFSAVTTAN